MNLLNNKRTKVIFTLVIFMLVGLVGYGVYSYYWTEGTFTGTDTITIASFNPQTYINDYEFLGEGGIVTLTCSTVSESNNNNVCTGSIDVTNNGSTPITVEVLNGSATTILTPVDSEHEDSHSAADDMSISLDSPSFIWGNEDGSSTTIAPEDSGMLNIRVYADISDGFENSNGIEANESIADQSGNSSYYRNYQVVVSFKLRAEQVH